MKTLSVVFPSYNVGKCQKLLLIRTIIKYPTNMVYLFKMFDFRLVCLYPLGVQTSNVSLMDPSHSFHKQPFAYTYHKAKH